MKHMRKALSLFLALAMIICFAVPAFAADTDTATRNGLCYDGNVHAGRI